MSYSVFVRTWWKKNPSWPDGREPDSGARKSYLERDVKTEEEARAIAKQYNATHPAGRFSRKAEFEEN